MKQKQSGDRGTISMLLACCQGIALFGCLGLWGLPVAAGAEESLEPSTRFFKTHPNPIDLEESGDRVRFANRQLGIEFKRSATGFQLTRLYGIAADEEFLAGARPIFHVVVNQDPMKVALDKRALTRTGGLGMLEAKTIQGDNFHIDSNDASDVSWRRDGTDDESVLHLEWNGIDVSGDKKAMSVEVTVTLRPGDPLSRWRINVRNRSKNYGIVRVRFPLLLLAPIGEAQDNMLLLPRSRGMLIENPFRHRNFWGVYPCHFNMQFHALYNRQRGKGIYLGTRDSAPHVQWMDIYNRSDEITWNLSHFPPNIAFADEDFELPYDFVVGPFDGDWFDACQIYREWAVKQPWCRKGPLLTRSDVPKWFNVSPLYFYTHLDDAYAGTHSEEQNLLIASEHFREFLDWSGMRLGAQIYAWRQYQPKRSTFEVPFFYGRHPQRGSVGPDNPRWRWAGMQGLNTHDGNYPKIPALANFSTECRRLREVGGMVFPYVCLNIFDQGASENSPYADEARPNVTRDLYGANRTFGIHTAWMPCASTQWWRDRLTETCVKLLQRENVGGVYLDTMTGVGSACCWTPHGHSAAGGTAMTAGAHGLVRTISDAVKAVDNEAAITGENSGENMIDLIDGILEVTLDADTRAPIFAAVYQDYINRYGLEISVGPGDAFFIECASLFVEGAKIGMLRLRPRSGSLSFQNPEHKEMLDFLGRVVSYYKLEQTSRFLAYGQLMRPLEFSQPSPMPLLPHKLRHGTTGEEAEASGGFPALMSGTFRLENGEIGIFVVNASSEDLTFHADLDPAQYQIPANARLNVVILASDGTSVPVHNEVTGTISLAGMLSGHAITMFRLEPVE